MRTKINKLLAEDIGENICSELHKDLLNKTQKICTIKIWKKNVETDFIRIKNFCCLKDTVESESDSHLVLSNSLQPYGL